jgi:hypothetical protein
MVQGLCQWNYKNMTGWGEVDERWGSEMGGNAHAFRLSLSTHRPLKVSSSTSPGALRTTRSHAPLWPGVPITLRQGARVIEDSRRLRLAWSDKGRQGGR